MALVGGDVGDRVCLWRRGERLGVDYCRAVEVDHLEAEVGWGGWMVRRWTGRRWNGFWLRENLRKSFEMVLDDSVDCAVEEF